MESKVEGKHRTWGEKHGGTIFGGGILVLLAVLVVLMSVCGP